MRTNQAHRADLDPLSTPTERRSCEQASAFFDGLCWLLVAAVGYWATYILITALSGDGGAF
jgi:hypothetical protein